MVERKPQARSRVRPRILILFLILGIPPLIVGHLILVSGARENYRVTIGNLLSQRADNSQTEIIGYLERISTQIANLTAVPEVVEVVATANRQQPTREELERQVKEIEARWSEWEPGTSDVMKSLLENEAALFLRKYNSVAITFRELLLTDVYGRLVAASSKTTDYYQADESWWQRSYVQGTGGRFISDLQFDDSADTYGMEIAEPVRDPQTRTVIGILKAIIDSNELFTMIESVQVGLGAEPMLLRPDGSVIYSPSARSEYGFAPQLRAALALGEPFIELEENGLDVFVGLPHFGIRDRLPELDWYLIIYAPAAEIYRPFQNVTAWFLYIVLFSVAIIIFLSLIFSWYLTKPVIEIDPHLEQI